MIRPATPYDIESVTQLGVEALSRNPTYQQHLVISREKIREQVRTCISSAQHFSWVSVDENNVVQGCVGALVHEMLFFERKQASVLMYYCKKPGDGIKMIRELMRWAKSRPIIKMVEFDLEIINDERLLHMLKRMGFINSLPALIYFK